MPITYTVDKQQNVVLVTWQGDVTEDEYRAHLRAMLQDADALRAGRCLTDLTHATSLLSGSQLNAVANSEAVPLLGGRPWKTAVLVGSTVNYGVARQYQILSESEQTDSVFRSRDAALAWLLED